LELINNLLDISKIEAGELKLSFYTIDLATFINQVHSIIKPLYEKKGLWFKINNEKKNQFLNADPVRLKEIFLNILSNAIKYTNEGGIELEIVEKEHLWLFNIIDTGIGIAKENHELIFKEFKTIENSDKNISKGTGLGLALTKRLVELHGGNISFTSELGKGSIFTFTIPKQTGEMPN